MSNLMSKIFVLLEPLAVIVIGILTIIILTLKWRGTKRTIVLVTGPVLLFIIQGFTRSLVIESINVERSIQVLGDLPALLYMFMLPIYYVILLIFATVQYFKTHKRA